jgi:UDP-2,4-diacetamido-2,4,6-trideoxy-beta-L-altropyranose hydrolase
MCFLGLPAIIVPIAENQIASSVRLAELGAVYTVNNSTNDFMDILSIKVRQLMASQSERRSMSEAGKKLVDGYGAERVVQAMLATTAVQGATHVRSA